MRRVDQSREPGWAAVDRMGCEGVEPVVPPAAVPGGGRHRHQLDRGDAELAQRAQPRDRAVERPLGREGADVELVERRAPRAGGRGPLRSRARPCRRHARARALLPAASGCTDPATPHRRRRTGSPRPARHAPRRPRHRLRPRSAPQRRAPTGTRRPRRSAPRRGRRRCRRRRGSRPAGGVRPDAGWRPPADGSGPQPAASALRSPRNDQSANARMSAMASPNASRDVHLVAREQVPRRLEHVGERVERRERLDPAVRSVERHVDRREEEDEEDRHLHQRAGLHRAQPHRDARMPTAAPQTLTSSASR